MTIEPTPHRYRVDACEPRSDPRRMATIRDVLTENILTVTTEDEARHLIAQLTAWLDAPRLAARATDDRGVAGDRCEYGNECGRTGCPECQQ